MATASRYCKNEKTSGERTPLCRTNLLRQFGVCIPEIFTQLHPTKNSGIDASGIRRASNKKVWWLCECGHEWQANPNSRTSRGRGCPACSGRVATLENNLVVKRPDLVAEWHPKNNQKPEDFRSSSGKKVWWLCGHGHEWEATIDHRNRGRGCPFCKGRKCSPERNLVKCFPKIAAEWHLTKNGLQPDKVMPVSAMIAWWICPFGHEYQLKVSRRTSGKLGCPQCQFRSLAEFRPEIAAQWHPSLNGSLCPKDVWVASKEKHYWQCPKFPSHFWKATVSNRTSANAGCPMCRESKGEKQVESILRKLMINYKKQFKFDNCRNKRLLPFDFVIFPSDKRMAVIEYHGVQHYRSIPYWGGIKKLKQTKKHDAIKENYCKEQKIPFLVIPYTEKAIGAKVNEFLMCF